METIEYLEKRITDLEERTSSTESEISKLFKYMKQHGMVVYQLVRRIRMGFEDCDASIRQQNDRTQSIAKGLSDIVQDIRMI